MSSCASFIFLFFFSFLNSFRVFAQDPTYIYHNCSETTTYSKNSTYSSNLNNLLSTLSSNINYFSNGFHKTVEGKSPDEVFGLFLCRGDISTEVCDNCVSFAVIDILIRCPEQKDGIIWYDECMLRYADHNIFPDSSLQNGTNGLLLWKNTGNFTSNEKDRYRDLILSMLNQSATEAEKSNRRFNARKANFTPLATLYVLVQCIIDMQKEDYLNCLRGIIAQLPTDNIGANIIVPSCNARFELYPFFNETNIGIPPPPHLDSSLPPPPPPHLDSSPPPPGLTIRFSVDTCFSATSLFRHSRFGKTRVSYVI